MMRIAENGTIEIKKSKIFYWSDLRRGKENCNYG